MFAACDQSNEVTTESASVDTSKIPVTTSSDAARELFLEGRALLDDLHFVEANGPTRRHARRMRTHRRAVQPPSRAVCAGRAHV